MATESQKIQNYFFVVLLVSSFILLYFIFRPFLGPIVLSFALAIVCAPFNEYFKRKTNSPSLAAIFAIILICFIVFLPLLAIGSLLFNEARNMYVSIAQSGGGTDTVHTIAASFEQYVQRFFPIAAIDIDTYIRSTLEYVVAHLSDFFSGFVQVLVQTFLILIILFYLFRDGKKLKDAYLDLSPLSDTHDRAILEKLSSAVDSVIKGSLIVALAQGILGGIGFTIFGMPNPVVLGLAVALASFIPVLGTSLIIGPSVIYLFVTHGAFSGIGLLVWGILAVGLIDNFLSPQLIRRGIAIHPMLILLSVLGGIVFFGPIGFIMGPISLALFFSLLDIYPSILKERSP